MIVIDKTLRGNCNVSMSVVRLRSISAAVFKLHLVGERTRASSSASPTLYSDILQLSLLLIVLQICSICISHKATCFCKDS
jgi:hypothetical protein